ncbi:hypothetical protein A1332_20770 [Methylomonas methanica]|uniref:Uncharacterized protein n=2 Tax=Methylomonas methanica TaxID=421 RepID=A0A177LZ89_METMH|nr:hypothetical protein A1332_20770 [Methylomonas methanica]
MTLEFKLQAWPIVLNTLKMAWITKKAFFNVISLPTLILLVYCALIFKYANNIGFPLMLLFMGILGIGFSWLAIMCHRLILVSDFKVSNNLDFRMGVRAAKFLAMSFQVFIVASLVETIVFMSMLFMFNGHLPSIGLEDIRFWIKLFSLVLGGYVTARLSLVLPATAMDKKVSLKWSWVITRGNGFNMFAIVCLFPLFFNFIITMLWRENATDIENAVLSIATFFVTAIEVIALSLTYKEFESFYSQ